MCVYVMWYYWLKSFRLAYPCEEGEVQLSNGESEREGHLEVCHNGQWQGICSKDITKTQTSQLCSHLGHSSEGIYIYI